jgi:hypothetical protein
MNYYQQGDVILRQATIPAGAKKSERVRGNDYILADGEVSGHAHKIKADKHIDLLEYEGKIYLRVKTAPAPVTHEEHHVIIVEPGDYEVYQVRERDHFNKMTRKVMD